MYTELFDEDEFEGLDVYHADRIEETIEEQLENDQLSPEEAGFMHGSGI